MNKEEFAVISRADARAQGLKYYFTGKPCKNGVIAQIMVRNYRCQCHSCREDFRKAERERYNRWYKKNGDKVAEIKRQYRNENLEAKREVERRSRKNNRDGVLERKRRYYQKNREKELKRSRRYREENPEKIRAKVSRRRAAKRERIPAWFGELDQFVLEEAFGLVAERLAVTGIEWHVDHMIPMRSRKASGLHCADNVQVIPAVMNLSKGNKMILTKPLEWLQSRRNKMKDMKKHHESERETIRKLLLEAEASGDAAKIKTARIAEETIKAVQRTEASSSF